MLVHYLLHRWEAIELFCKSISKYEGDKEKETETEDRKDKYKPEFTLEDFKNNSAIIHATRKYSNKKHCEEFTEKAFSNTNKQLLYNLGLWIKAGRPVILSETELTDLLKYIGEKDTLDRYDNIMPVEFSTTQRALERTQWWLYNFDDYEDESGNIIEGITRAVVYLNPFARVEIVNYKPGDKMIEVYKGKYNVEENKYLRLELTIRRTFGKDLTILGYIGENEPKEIDLILGQYHNIDQEHIYSGTVLLQRIATPVEGELAPKFFNKDDPEEAKLIDARIWAYFKNKSQNRIRVKPGIVTMDRFSVWLNKQDKKRKQRGEVKGSGLETIE